MRLLRARRVGFTLVELLVVIAIITVLVAIVLPVYSRARERARQSACMANLQQIAMAVRMYRMDQGHYPGPYDAATGEGGLNALYPAYISDRGALTCPDDRGVDNQNYIDRYEQLLLTAGTMYLWEDPGFFLEHYSSYNKLYNWMGYVWFWPPGTDENGDPEYTAWYSLLDLGQEELGWGDNIADRYMWHRWDPNNDLGVWGSGSVFELVDRHLHYHLAQQVYWYGYDAFDLEAGDRMKDTLQRPLWDPGNPDPAAWDYMPYGMPSPVFPGLINRNAPDNTIITRCPHHRRYTITKTRIKGTTGGEKGQPGAGAPSFNTTVEEVGSPQDIVLRLGGSCSLITGLDYDWARQTQRLR
jgi:prepilin-type N-terminal cleavage/methylation domain-containing protein